MKSDPGLLRQVVLNLLSNAITFTSIGVVTVVLGESPHGAPGNVFIVISVIDTGIGMTPDQLTRLFQSFSQADPSIACRFGGTSLGLAISRRLCLQMGGDLMASSGIGRGSPFTAQIVCDRVGDSTSAGNPLTKRYAISYPVLHGWVLVVEDNAINAAVTSAMLRRVGLTATVAPSGDYALSVIERAAFDQELMDYQMPGKDGLVTTRDIHSREAAAGRRQAGTSPCSP